MSPLEVKCGEQPESHHSSRQKSSERRRSRVHGHGRHRSERRQEPTSVTQTQRESRTATALGPETELRQRIVAQARSTAGDGDVDLSHEDVALESGVEGDPDDEVSKNGGEVNDQDWEQDHSRGPNENRPLSSRGPAEWIEVIEERSEPASSSTRSSNSFWQRSPPPSRSTVTRERLVTQQEPTQYPASSSSTSSLQPRASVVDYMEAHGAMESQPPRQHVGASSSSSALPVPSLRRSGAVAYACNSGSASSQPPRQHIGVSYSSSSPDPSLSRSEVAAQASHHDQNTGNGGNLDEHRANPGYEQVLLHRPSRRPQGEFNQPPGQPGLRSEGLSQYSLSGQPDSIQQVPSAEDSRRIISRDSLRANDRRLHVRTREDSRVAVQYLEQDGIVPTDYLRGILQSSSSSASSRAPDRRPSDSRRQTTSHARGQRFVNDGSDDAIQYPSRSSARQVYPRIAVHGEQYRQSVDVQASGSSIRQTSGRVSDQMNRQTTAMPAAQAPAASSSSASTAAIARRPSLGQMAADIGMALRLPPTRLTARLRREHLAKLGAA